MKLALGIFIGLIIGFVCGLYFKFQEVNFKQKSIIVRFQPELSIEAVRVVDENKVILSFKDEEDYNGAVQLVTDSTEHLDIWLPELRKRQKK